MCDDIVHDQNRVVDQHADDDGQARKRQDIEREARRPHQRERHDDGRRHHDGDDQRGTPGAQEQEQRQGGEQDANDHIVGHVGQRAAHELRIVHDDVQRGAGLRLHDQHHGVARPVLAATEARGGARLAVGVYDIGDIADPDARPTGGRHLDSGYRIDRLHAPRHAHVDLVTALGEVPGRHVHLRRPQGIGHGSDGDAQPPQIARTQTHLHLAPLTAGQRHTRHARHLRDQGGKLLVGDAIQFIGGLRPCQRQGHDRLRCDVQLLHNRVVRVIGQVRTNQVDLAAQVLRLDVDVLVQIELDHHHREPGLRKRLELVNARDGTDGVLHTL